MGTVSGCEPGELRTSYVGHLSVVLGIDASERPRGVSIMTAWPLYGDRMLIERMSAWTLGANTQRAQLP